MGYQQEVKALFSNICKHRIVGKICNMYLRDTTVRLLGQQTFNLISFRELDLICRARVRIKCLFSILILSKWKVKQTQTQLEKTRLDTPVNTPFLKLEIPYVNQ